MTRLIDVDALDWGQVENEHGRRNPSVVACEILIENAPTINIESKWVPCSERLPKVTETVLVQDICGDIETAQVCTHYDGSLIFDGEWEYELKEVVAWMPLQTPYKESEVKE